MAPDHKRILAEMSQSYDTLDKEAHPIYVHEEEHLKIDNQRLKMKVANLPSHIREKEKRP